MFKFFALFFVLAVLSTETFARELNCDENANEEYQCGSACQRTCATLGQRCPIVNIRCNDGCYCIDGYARDHRGVCIPIKNCPKKHNPKITRVPLYRLDKDE